MRFAFLGIMSALLLSNSAACDETAAYLDSAKSFVLIENINRQADAWGMCASTYRILSSLYEESMPARAKKLSELGNGAAMSVVMTHLSDVILGNGSPENFSAAFDYSKILYDSIPEAMTTHILADKESLEAAGSDIFIDKLAATFNICTGNLKDQEMYVDLWRELAKSGLVTFSDE